MCSGSIPQAYNVHSGAPDPPVKRDHWSSELGNDHGQVEPPITYNILVRVHEYPEAIFLDFIKHFDNVVKVRVIVFSRTLVLQSLPSEDEAEDVEPPSTKSSKVLIGRAIIEIERTAYEVTSTLFGSLPKVMRAP